MSQQKNTNPDLAVALAFLAGGLLGSALRKPERAQEFEGKTALVTGGTRGLGRALVRELASRGAKVVFCARHADEIERSQASLEVEGLSGVLGMVADLSRPNTPEELVARVEQTLGAVDILINNAGIIQVAPFLNTREESFHQCLDLFLYAPLRLSTAVLPQMLSQGEGTIVNIASVGGQVPSPHMTAYNCGKSALVALSEGMSVELGRYGVNVLTVVPGLMRTGGHRNAEFAGKPDKEYAWFSRAAIHPALAACPYRVARKVVDGIRDRNRTLYPGWEAKLGPRFHRLFPDITLAVSSMINRLLPRPGREDEPRSGHLLAHNEGSQMSSIMRKLEESVLREHQAARLPLVP